MTEQPRFRRAAVLLATALGLVVALIVLVAWLYRAGASQGAMLAPEPLRHGTATITTCEPSWPFEQRCRARVEWEPAGRWRQSGLDPSRDVVVHAPGPLSGEVAVVGRSAYRGKWASKEVVVPASLGQHVSTGWVAGALAVIPMLGAATLVARAAEREARRLREAGRPGAGAGDGSAGR